MVFLPGPRVVDTHVAQLFYAESGFPCMILKMFKRVHTIVSLFLIMARKWVPVAVIVSSSW